FLSWHRHHRDLHSFPTRRSSDLLCHDCLLLWAAMMRGANGNGQTLTIKPVSTSRVVAHDFSSVYPSSGCSSRNRRASASSFSRVDRKSTRLNSSHRTISYAVFCL